MKKVLAVDDEDLMLFSLSAMFPKEEADVMTAATGHDALQAIGRYRFDLCFLDIHLPDMNGLDIMMKLRELSPETRIAIMTGGEVTGTMMDSIRMNAELLLSKPFDLFQVKTIIDQILKQGRYLCPREQGAPTDQDWGIQWIAGDARNHVRRPADKRLAYLAVPSPHEISAEVRSGRVVDISDDGLGLLTECPLATGSVLRFVQGIAWFTGVVRWNAGTGAENEYRAGIKFLTSESGPDDRLLPAERQ